MIDSKETEKPILVTGAHRSGTTWVAKMLSLFGESQIAEEPFNVESSNYGFGGLAEGHFTYAPGLEQKAALETFGKIYNMETGKIFKRSTLQHYFKRARKGRLIIKDPIACLSSDWITKNFDLKVLILVRHPCAFTNSLQRMGWEPDLSMFTQQEKLVEDHLLPLLPEIEAYDTDFDSRCAMTWKILYHILNKYAEEHPNWIIKTHEELSLNPSEEFRHLYEQLGLKWSPQLQKQIEAHTGNGNQKQPVGTQQHCLYRDSRANAFRWKEQMSNKRIEHIKNLTFPQWSNYYNESHWSSPQAIKEERIAS